MAARFMLPLLVTFWVASAEEWTYGESLLDDPPAEGEVLGESLFDDDPPPAGGGDDVDAGYDDIDPREILFGSDSGLSLTADIVFDEAGNVKEGGSKDPDISFWRIVEYDGERINEPTDGSSKLMAALESGEAYAVKFAPPDASRLKCNEKVEPLGVVLESGWHDMSQELVDRALAILANEGVLNTKQLGELAEKDYDAIPIPAIIKSRLRAARAEAQRQAETAANPVAMDSAEIQDQMRSFISARKAAQGENASGGAAAQAAPTSSQEQAATAGDSAPVLEESEEDGTFKSLVWAIMNCPTCKGKETVTCLQNCRYGTDLLGQASEPGTWTECLNKCVTNSWIRGTFRMLLPSGS